MTLVLIAVAGFISWLVNTIGAGGGEFIFISAVAYLLEPQAVAPVVTLANLFGVPSRVVLFRHHIDWRIVRWFLIGAVPGGIIGACLFARTSADWLQFLLGIFLLSAPLQYRFGERERSFEVRLWWFLPAGFGLALVSGLIGGTGPVMNTLYLNYGTTKEDMIGTKSVNSFAMHLSKIGTYTALGAVTADYLWYGLSVGVVAVLANWLAKQWLRRISAQRFRQVVIWLMALSGLFMTWRSRAVILGT